VSRVEILRNPAWHGLFPIGRSVSIHGDPHRPRAKDLKDAKGKVGG